MLPRTKIQWALGAATAIAGTWLYFVRDFEPLLATVTSAIAYAASLTRRDTDKARDAREPTAGFGPPPASLLRSASILDRPKILRESYAHLPPLSGREIADTLESLSVLDRPKLLPLLLTRLGATLSESETDAILKTLSVLDVPVAASQLAKARPIANPTQQNEA
jgi:hypothetical protein